MKHTTETKPGVVTDMAAFGRQPDTATTDMSHLRRNLAKARSSNAGKLEPGAPDQGSAPRNRYFNSDPGAA